MLCTHNGTYWGYEYDDYESAMILTRSTGSGLNGTFTMSNGWGTVAMTMESSGNCNVSASGDEGTFTLSGTFSNDGGILTISGLEELFGRIKRFAYNGTRILRMFYPSVSSLPEY